MISIDNYSNSILKNVNLQIPWGFIGILGPSGIGKSTLLKIIHAKKDDLHISGSIDRLFQNSSYMPQESMFFPHLTLEENLLLVLECDENLQRENIIKEMRELMVYFSLAPNMNVTKMSGGQKQRLAIVRLLLQNRELAIMDEPTSALDAQNIDLFCNIIRKKCKNALIISHDVTLLENLCKNFIFIGPNFNVEIYSNLLPSEEKSQSFRDFLSNNNNNRSDAANS